MTLNLKSDRHSLIGHLSLLQAIPPDNSIHIFTLSHMSASFRQPDGSESPLLPPELCLLISDCLEAPATFLVAQHLGQALKAKRRCMLFGLSQSSDYYNAILRKQVRLNKLTFLVFISLLDANFHTLHQGTQLISERERGNFEYVDVAPMLLALGDGSDLSTSILDKLRQYPWKGALVIFDDFSGLLHSGLDPLQALRLYRKLQHLIRRVC